MELSSAPGSAIFAPYSCTAGIDDCNYFLSGSSVYFSFPCECGLNGQGYCPIPTSEDVMNSYTDSFKIVMSASQCHTNDRYNLLAQIDCGIGEGDTDLIAAAMG